MNHSRASGDHRPLATAPNFDCNFRSPTTGPSQTRTDSTRNNSTVAVGCDSIQTNRTLWAGLTLHTHTHTYTWSRVRNSIKCRCKLPTQIASAKASIQSLKKWNYLFCFCSFSVSRSFPSFFFCYFVSLYFSIGYRSREMWKGGTCSVV